MAYEVRKIISYVEKTCIEGGKPAERPLVMIVAAAVIRNPWAGLPFQKACVHQIRKNARFPPLGELLVAEILRRAGSAARSKAYGKAAVVGTSEVEHRRLIRTALWQCLPQYRGRHPATWLSPTRAAARAALLPCP